MASPYDERLLAEAPEVTKADLQDGYNPDLLREPTVKRKNTTRGISTPPPSNPDPHPYSLPDKDLESSTTPLQSKADIHEEPRKPFWRTTKGIIIMAVAGVLIILAAVLGGVLGSRKGNGGGTESFAPDNSTSTSPVPAGAASDQPNNVPRPSETTVAIGADGTPSSVTTATSTAANPAGSTQPASPNVGGNGEGVGNPGGAGNGGTGDLGNPRAPPVGRILQS